MNLMDASGHRVSGATSRSLELFEQASRELLCMVDDPVASVAGGRRPCAWKT